MELNASYHQERLWFIDKFEAGNLYEAGPIYHNIPLILEIDGPLDHSVLEQSIREVINRHEVLRTKIITVDNNPLQVIEDDVDFELQILQVSLSSTDDPQGQMIELAVEISKTPFQLDSDLLIRAGLLSVDNEKNVLVITVHHIAADRYTLAILAREIFDYYNAFKNNSTPPLPELPIHYADFAIYQQEMPEDVLESLLFYWKRQLKGKIQPLQFHSDFPRAAIHIFREGRHAFELSPLLSQRLNHLQHRAGTPVPDILLSAFKVLLHRYTRQDDITIGTARTNREQPEVKHVAGPIGNLLPLRSHFSSDIPFDRLLSNVSRTLTNALKNGEIPFDRLVLELSPEKDMSRTALFDVLFQYENTPIEIPEVEHLQFKTHETNLGWGKYDFNLWIQGETRNSGDNNKSVNGILVYNRDYYKASTISRLVNHYINLLESVLETPEQAISAISFLSENERRDLVEEWNQTRAAYPTDKTILHLFEEQAVKTPDNTALVFEDTQLTYQQLNRLANRFAYHLETHAPTRSNDPAAVLVERSERMFVVLLAVLKTRSAYVPIDPSYPGERIEYILKDSACTLIIADPGYENKAGNHSNRILSTNLLFEESDSSDGNDKSLINPSHQSRPPGYSLCDLYLRHHRISQRLYGFAP